MESEIRTLLENADKACQSFLGRFDEKTEHSKYEHELMPIFDCMTQVARAWMSDMPQELHGHGAIELATFEVTAPITGNKKATAVVLLDQFKKLQLIFVPLCPVHGTECPDAVSSPPRNVTLKELRLIGLTGVGLVKHLHTFLHESLVETIVNMPAPEGEQ